MSVPSDILITGGDGFLGSFLGSELSWSGYTVCKADKKRGMDLLSRHAFQNVLERSEAKTVFHLAAQVGRLFGEDDLVHTLRTNAELTTIVAKACADAGVKLIYASTSEVYGDQGLLTCNEHDPCVLPHNLYGLTKRWGEEVCQLYMPEEDLKILRISMPYGPGVVPGRGRAALPNIVWQAYNRLEIPIHKNAERSWCYVTDTTRAFRMIMEDGEHGIYNVGRSDNKTSMLDIAYKACAITDAPTELIKLIDAPGNQTVIKRLGTKKLEDLGWAPMTSLDGGMQKVLQWVSRFDEFGNLKPR